MANDEAGHPALCKWCGCLLADLADKYCDVCAQDLEAEWRFESEREARHGA